MKEWKLEVLKKLDEKSKEVREIKLYDVAREMGINHIKTQEVHEIVKKFLEAHPDYKAYQLTDNKLDSLFCSLMFSDAEYDNEEVI